MAKKQKSEVRSQKTEDRSQQVDAGAEAPVQAEACPTYTLHADTGFGMLGMLALHRLAQDWGGPAELRREVEGVMREFEFWEEAHRGDPAA